MVRNKIIFLFIILLYINAIFADNDDIHGFAVNYPNLPTTEVSVAFTPYYNKDTNKSLNKCANSKQIYTQVVKHIVGASNLSSLPNLWNSYEYFNCRSAATKLIVDRINQAQKSILVAAYSFSNPDIVYALIQKHKQGVNVEVILDKSNLRAVNSAIEVLANNDIPVYISSGYAIMHNKFIIIDNKSVQTGSLNYTIEGITQQANNVMVLDSPIIANSYKSRWDSIRNHISTSPYKLGDWHPTESSFMPYGYTTPISTARTSGKSILKLQTFSLNQLNIAIIQGLGYTDPSDKHKINPNCMDDLATAGGICMANYRNDSIVELIKNSKHSINMVSMLITDIGVANELIKAHERGVKVQIVADYSQNKSLGKFSKLSALASNGIEVKLNNKYQILHDKYMIIDGTTLQTGSYNYSVSAYKYNAENYLIFYNQVELAKIYQKDFQELYKEGLLLN